MGEKIELIWQEYHDKLLSFILKRVKNKTIAEDILQDVFLKILSKIHTLKDTSKLKSWLYQVTRNAVSDYHNNSEKLNNIYADKPDTVFEDEENVQEEVAGWLGSLIKSLPDKYREAIELSEFEGVSQKDISGKLNISYPAVRSRVRRGRLMLKDKLTACCLFNVDVYGNVLDYCGKNNKCRAC
jgi:RNA polymerase sigma-70 factor (ECF subfamily)